MIISITITYQPDLATLRKQLESLRSQVASMWVIDNGSSEAKLESLQRLCKEFNVALQTLGYNSGIAHAQNVGIAAARAEGATHILLMDQDSEASPSMVATLAETLEAVPHAAAAGPSTYDMRTGRSTFFPIDFVKGYWPKHWRPINGVFPQSVEVAALISSGSLIRISALPEEKPMLEDWFIDHVDTEWCFRIRAKGWVLLGVPKTQLKHQLGDKISQVWFFGWKPVAHHSPLRDYYMFRNSVLLVKKDYVPWRWKIYLVARLFLFWTFFIIYTPQRLNRMKMTAMGIFDGIRGHVGQWK